MRKLLLLSVLTASLAWTEIANASSGNIYCPDTVTCSEDNILKCNRIKANVENYQWKPYSGFHINSQEIYVFRKVTTINFSVLCIYCKEYDSSCSQSYISYALFDPDGIRPIISPDTQFLLRDGKVAWSSAIEEGTCDGSYNGNKLYNSLSCPFIDSRS